MTVIAMSRREIDRMHVLRDMAAGRITASEAAQLMRLTRRHVFRLAKAYRERGPAALISTRRGKPSNRRYPAALWTEVLALIKANYPDFGPTLAREKLAERHDIHLGVETLRQWMLADGLWRDRKQRLKPVHQPRYRRDCVGELVQIDAPSMGGSRTAARRARSWCSSTTRRAVSCTCASCQPSRPSTTSKPRGPTCSATASRWRSTPTSTACSGSIARTRRAATA